MSVSQRRGNMGKADRYWSLIIRSRGACEYPGCGYSCSCDNFPQGHRSDCKLDAAHIIRRGRGAWVRTDISNGLCMCKTHHSLIDNYADEMMMVVEATIGRAAYDALRVSANEGIGRKFEWEAEVERLRAIAEGVTK